MNLKTDSDDYLSHAQNCFLKAISFATDIKNSEFDPFQFFFNWFGKPESKLFFLFKKNLKITNIQYAELISLIRNNLSDVGTGKPVDNLIFITNNSFSDILKSIFTPLINSGLNAKKIDEEFTYLTSALIGKVIVVDPYFGSCAVYIPDHLKLNIRKVCYESGYIHSCGHSIYIRSTTKSNKDDLYKNLTDHIEFKNSKDKLFFAIYCHEDHTKHDRRFEYELRDGLDDVKLYLDKSYIGDTSMPELIQDMRQIFKDQLIIPMPGNFRETHSKARENPNILKDSAIWLIRDNQVSEVKQNRSDEVYYICYEQLYKNDNQTYIFDEDKPAWIVNNTIPHALMSAMINITKPWLMRETCVVADPFMGSGTSLLEIIKNDGVIFYGSDLEQVACLLALDNIEFYSKNMKWINKVIEEIGEYADGMLIDEPLIFVDEWVAEISDLIEALRRKSKSKLNLEFDDESRLALSKYKYEKRILFYIFVKAYIRNIGGLLRESTTFNDALRSELKELNNKLLVYKESTNMHENKSERDGVMNIYEGKYSKAIATDKLKYEEIVSGRARKIKINKRNIMEMEENMYDVIVTDPPYGFNTEEDIIKLSHLYKDMFKVLIKGVRDYGHIVIALPEKSKAGRMLPFCVDKEFVVNQMLAEVELCNCEIVAPALSMPIKGAYLRPPYYWESEKAMRRCVLHFVIRKHSAVQKDKN